MVEPKPDEVVPIVEVVVIIVVTFLNITKMFRCPPRTVRIKASLPATVRQAFDRILIEDPKNLK